MSVKERDRLKVIDTLTQQPDGPRRLTQAQAAKQLDISERHLRRLQRRYEKEGDAGLIHRSRGRPSNRKFSDSFREQVLAHVREQYADFGPTLASEKLAERDGLTVSRETLRRWMIEDGLWKPKRRKARHCQARERKPAFGEMVQMDTSEHDWFEGRGEAPVLIAMVDDATSRVFMRFHATDSTRTNMLMLRDYIRDFGRPLAIYADRASHFMTTSPATVDEQLQGLEAETQIQRALRELNMEYIAAHSPQAKGRVERIFLLAQDRLVKEMRLAGINTIETANELLEDTFIPLCNDRFIAEPACSMDAHRSTEGFDLDAILSRQETRTVTNDYTIQFRNTRYQIARDSVLAGLRAAKVIVEERLDGSVQVRFKERYLHVTALPQQPAKAKAGEAATRKKTKPRDTERRAHKPAPDHPWRRSYKSMRQPRRAYR